MKSGTIGKAPVKACAGDSRSAIGQCWSVDFDVHTQHRSDVTGAKHASPDEPLVRGTR